MTQIQRDRAANEPGGDPQRIVISLGRWPRRCFGASVKEQTEGILKRIDALLKAAGTDKSKLLSARCGWRTCGVPRR
jgi:enamine deaminase RidA (YjgF/YER057c/UK114 family)